MPPLSDDAPSSRRAKDGDHPTRGDYARLSAVVEKLTATLEAMPDKMERIYLRQDIYQRDLLVHDKEHESIKNNLSSINTVMKVVASVIGTSILLALMSLILIRG